MKAVIETERKYYKYNVTEVGNLTKNRGILSGFNDNDYAIIPISFNPNYDSFEIVVYCTVDNNNTGYVLAGSDNSTMAVIADDGTWTSTNGYTYNFYVPGNEATQPAKGTGFYRKFSRLGNVYYNHYSLDGISWIETGNYTDSGYCNQATLCLGRYPFEASNYFNGTIDLSKSYIKINNQLVWQGVIESTVSDYDYSVGDNTVKLVKEGNNYYVFNL